MNFKNYFLPAILGIVLLFSGCGDQDLKKDAIRIGDAMCRNIAILNKMKNSNPADSVYMNDLRAQSDKLQVEMTVMYKEFNKKYGEKVRDQKFTKKFNLELRKAMLGCPYLSSQDRQLFEEEIKK